ncbi:MAG: hypothetical protein HQK91_09260 [Nitrospirae bacterium]|nr:hypothetical protein [Nitrospirota bacterium]MBF0541620.1 hypothetical protein [Nitrospirota bacterium]
MHNHNADGCPSCSSIKPTAPENPTDYRLTHWPIQINLMGTVVPFIQNADLLIAADCTAFAALNFHERFLKNKKVLIGCPKLDNSQNYIEKFTEIFSQNPIQKVTCLRMEVPCCGGMTAILKEAITRSKHSIPMTEIIIGVKGDLLSEKSILR